MALAGLGLKVCGKCRIMAPLVAFAEAKRYRDGRQSWCRSCMAEHQRSEGQVQRRKREYARRKREPGFAEKSRASSLWHRYRLRLDEFDAMLRAQGGVCAICATAEPGGVGTWHVDHDHQCCPGSRSCGQCIRGVLCSRCNLQLGAYEVVAQNKAFMSYLERASNGKGAFVTG